jgi:rhodanese-related sulfurtransferase
MLREVILVAAERIPIPELKKKLDARKNLVVVDVRETSEIKDGGAIPGAIHIPVAEIEKRAGELPKNAEIVFY